MNETIEKYLLGELSADELAKFEANMASDGELREEVETYRLIFDAFEREKIKKELTLVEKQIQSRNARIKWAKISSYSLALAACLTFVIIHYSAVNTMKDYGSYYLSQTPDYVVRGGSNIDSLISVSLTQIEKAEYNLALGNLSLGMQILDTTVFDSSTPEGSYLSQIAIVKRQDIIWYKALVLMKNGKVWKAKKLLKEIRNSNGIYSNDADIILSKK